MMVHLTIRLNNSSSFNILGISIIFALERFNDDERLLSSEV